MENFPDTTARQHNGMKGGPGQRRLHTLAVFVNGMEMQVHDGTRESLEDDIQQFIIPLKTESQRECEEAGLADGDNACGCISCLMTDQQTYGSPQPLPEECERSERGDPWLQKAELPGAPTGCS